VRKGFTLIELIVVIAIIAILAAIIAPNAFRAIAKARIARTVGEYKSIKTAALMHQVDCNAFPNSSGTGEGFTAIQAASCTATNWDGPYIEAWPGNEFDAASDAWFCNDNSATTPCSVDFDAASTAGSRYVGLINVTAPENVSIEAAIDDGVATTGIVRHNATAPTSTALFIEGDL